MTDRADELIEAFYNKEEYLREAADYYPAESGSRRTLLEIANLIAHFRDAVNEKPHEARAEIVQVAGTVIPPSRVTWTDGLGNTGSYEQPGHVIGASPPHAAAEPEKPMDQAMPFYCADCGSTTAGVHSLQCPETAAAEPVGQPICYLRMLNGKPDWDEHCVSARPDDLMEGLDDDEPNEAYAIIPLYASPSAQPIALDRYAIQCLTCAEWHGFHIPGCPNADAAPSPAQPIAPPRATKMELLAARLTAAPFCETCRDMREEVAGQLYAMGD